VAAGLVAFAIGSETLGSISSPSTRCGVTGLRPTFGRVPRTGAMALSWSMDKLGPMCRSAEDCALVLDAIRGPDGRDAACADAPFRWEPRRPLAGLRVGYVRAAFELPEADPKDPRAPRTRRARSTTRRSPCCATGSACASRRSRSPTRRGTRCA
jgi:Asp-tRNA(Asn)/Glu-tRNA(Gln) amidotransferase A subunit family amidase